MQLLIGERALVTGLAFPNYCRFVATRSNQMPVQAVFGNVEFPPHEPFRERRLPFDTLLPWPAPNQLLRFARPELARLPDRFPIHPPILSQALDSRFTAETRRRLENALFDQVRFDVLVHEQFLISARTFEGKRALPRNRRFAADQPVRVPKRGGQMALVIRWTAARPWLHVEDARIAPGRVFHARSVATGAESTRGE